MSLNTLSHWVSRLALIVVGIAVGIGLVILVQMNATAVLDAALLWGAAAGVGAFLLAALLYAALRPKTFVKDDAASTSINTDQAQQAAMRLAARLGLPEEEVTSALPLIKQQLLHLAQLVARFWSSATALGAAVAITGSVIAMVTAIAALRQVDRIDAQNALLEQQIEEAQASRAASVFAAQLPSLLAAMDAERARASVEDEKWSPSNALRARIQSTVDTAEAYVRISAVEQAIVGLNNALPEHKVSAVDPLSSMLSAPGPIPKMQYSPQRGQLLRLLIASNLDFVSIDPPLDFSGSDFSGLELGPAFGPAVDLGRTDLSKSNFLDAEIGRVDLTEVSLAFSAFDTILQLNVPITRWDRSSKYEGGPKFEFDPFKSLGTDMRNIILVNDSFATIGVPNGWIGNNMLFEADRSALEMNEGKHRMPTLQNLVRLENLASFSSVLAQDGSNVRLGPPEPLLRLYMSAVVAQATASDDETAQCPEPELPSLRQVQQAIWYSKQSNSHPKWKAMVEMVLASLSEDERGCFTDYGTEVSTPPEAFDLEAVEQAWDSIRQLR